ncbi:MAG TPA: ParD-like family protein, partial [Pseudomonadales bacterium]|nr:ParD-like family protein [Pseudomonadales bacterium]
LGSYRICSNLVAVNTVLSRRHKMSTSTSIRIDQKLYEQARSEAVSEHRTIAGQIEYWAKVGRAALDNPDLPVSFIAESLAALAESRTEVTDFAPRSRRA